MKIILESLRFMLIYFLFAAISGFIFFFMFSVIGANPEKYDWIVFIVALIVTLVLYKYKRWGKIFQRSSLWIALVLIVLFTLVIPDMSPVHFYSSKYVYSYGFPFPFLKLYVDNGSSFLLPNLFANGFTGWSGNVNVLFNFFFYYILLSLIMKNRQSNGLVTE